MPEDDYGSAPVRPAASNPQLGALTDVVHKLRILTNQHTLTVSQLLRLNIAALRALRREEENLLARRRVPPKAGLTASASTLLFAKG